jgi:TRAP transporter TAXI family solute receptor
MRALLAAILALAASTAFAHAQDMRDMSILTGKTTGTYYRFGQDIAALILKDCGAEIAVKESQGSLANLQRLRHEANSQLAIVQQDTLDYLKTAAGADPKLQNIARSIRYVFPLYSEEVHLVTTKGSGIKRLKDIAGKRVAVGEGESGTYLTASFILLLSRIDVTPVEVGQAEGLRRLLLPAGDPFKIDALFYVAGTPVKLFTENKALRDQLAGVAIDDPVVLERYTPAKLTSADYGWITDKVDTVQVRSVLMTYDFQKHQCQNVGMVANRLKANLTSLKNETGHPKWAEVDLNAPLQGWQPYSCVTKYIDAEVDQDGERRCAFVESASTSAYIPPGQKGGAAVQAEKPEKTLDNPVCESGRTQNPIVQSLCKNMKELQK